MGESLDIMVILMLQLKIVLVLLNTYVCTRQKLAIEVKKISDTAFKFSGPNRGSNRFKRFRI